MRKSRTKSPLRLRASHINIEDIPTTKVDIIGDLPCVAMNRDIELSISLFDCADEGIHPILSYEPLFQEDASAAYELRLTLDEIGGLPNKIRKWTSIAIIPETVLLPPYSGERRVRGVVRLLDMEKEVIVAGGEVIENHTGILWIGEFYFNFSTYSGYIALEKQRRRIQSIMLRIALAVAMSDGTLSPTEHDVITERAFEWQVSAMYRYDGLTYQKRKTSYKGMITRAMNKAKANDLKLDTLINSLYRLATRSEWGETLNICSDVIISNGVADNKQFRDLNYISSHAPLDPMVIGNIRDKIIMELDLTQIIQGESYEFLGIDDTWDILTTRRYLRAEYKKWNGRLNTVPDGRARHNTQAILDMIGNAYKKYTTPHKKAMSQTTSSNQPSQTSNESLIDPSQLKIFDDSN